MDEAGRRAERRDEGRDHPDRQQQRAGFLPVANPDGYDYTFTPDNRLWRKNLRDNNNDGKITPDPDGVDPNRNFPTNWNYDNEGSSSEFASETYRGPGPGSEAETKAFQKLLDRVGFEMNVNYHTAA